MGIRFSVRLPITHSTCDYERRLGSVTGYLEIGGQYAARLGDLY
jgi:hypothetical protein